MSPAETTKYFFKDQILWLVLSAGLIARLYAYTHAYVINPDGAYYIYQAKAISNNMWGNTASCGYPFISLYPVFIVLFQKIFNDWVTASKAVSLFFGTITIIPFYFLMKRFFSRTMTGIITLTFALNPLLVETSANLIKDSLFWFFSVLAILLYVTASDKNKGILFFLSSLTFFLAGFARIEALSFYAGSLLYLLFRRKRSMKSIVFFSAPVLMIFIGIMASFFISEKGLSMWSIYVEPRFENLFTHVSHNPFNNEMTDKLKELNREGVEFIPDDFFSTIKNMLWYIALGFLLGDAVNAFYLPFFILMIYGLIDSGKEIKKEPLIGYFILLSALSFLFVYAFLINSWSIDKRYIAVIMFPSFIFIGFGFQKLLYTMAAGGIREKLLIPVTCIAIILITLPENLESEGKDILAYKDIGERIALETGGRVSRIATSEKRIITYASLSSSDVMCPDPLIEYREMPQMTYPEMVALLKENSMEYFVWEEAQWIDASYNFMEEVNAGDMIEIDRWDAGENKLALFKIAPPE